MPGRWRAKPTWPGLLSMLGLGARESLQLEAVGDVPMTSPCFSADNSPSPASLGRRDCVPAARGDLPRGDGRRGGEGSSRPYGSAANPPIDYQPRSSQTS